MRLSIRVAVIVLCLPALSLGCAGADSSRPSATTVPETQSLEASAESANSLATTAAEAVETVEVNPKIYWNDADDSSFRAEYKMDFEGTVDGQPASFTVSMLLEYTREPLRKRVVMDVANLDLGIEGYSGNDASIRVTYIVDANTTYINYRQGGEESGWVSVPESTFDQMDDVFLFPTEVLEFPAYAQLTTAEETVNGFASTRYDLTQEFSSINGEGMGSTGATVWVATPGDFLTRMRAGIEADFSGDRAGESGLGPGTMQLSFDMLEVNQLLSIDLPDTFSSAPTTP